MTGWDRFNGMMSESDIRNELKSVPADIALFLNTEIQPVIASQKKVLAIKTLRDESGCSLKLAKRIVDELSNGTPISDTQFGDPKLIDAIEYAEQACKQAIRAASDDSKAAAALLGIREQLADLWTDMVELPLPPEATSAWEQKA